MDTVRRIRRLAGLLAGMAGALLTFAAAGPAAFASGRPALPQGWNKHPPLPAHVRTVIVGGMPGWQIILIAVAAALVAAAAALLADRGIQRVRAAATSAVSSELRT